MGEINSSVGEINNFAESTLHQDYIRELDLRIEETSMMLDDFDSQYTGRQYDVFRGRKRNLQEMKEIFLEMAKNKASDLELKEGESNV